MIVKTSSSKWSVLFISHSFRGCNLGVSSYSLYTDGCKHKATNTRYNLLSMYTTAGSFNMEPCWRQAAKAPALPLTGCVDRNKHRISASMLGNITILQKASKAFTEAIPLCLTWTISVVYPHGHIQALISPKMVPTKHLKSIFSFISILTLTHFLSIYKQLVLSWFLRSRNISGILPFVLVFFPLHPQLLIL